MKNPVLKKIRNFFLVVLVQVLRFVISFIPWRGGRKIGEAIGLLAIRLLPREKAKIFKNLEIVYPGKMSVEEKEAFARENARNYGIIFFEFIKLSTLPFGAVASLVKEVEGIEELYRLKKEGRSCIGVTAHFSNWEILSAYVCSRGFDLGAVGKRIFDPQLDALVNASRNKSKIKIFDKDSIVSRDMIKGLKGSMMLGMVVDQDTNVESMMIPFLGHDAKTPVAPAILAKKFRTYMCTTFMVRRDDGYYKFIVNKPFEPGPSDTVEKIARWYNKDISDMILKYPHQWAWVHERWKSVNK